MEKGPHTAPGKPGDLFQPRAPGTLSQGGQGHTGALGIQISQPQGHHCQNPKAGLVPDVSSPAGIGNSDRSGESALEHK